MSNSRKRTRPPGKVSAKVVQPPNGGAEDVDPTSGDDASVIADPVSDATETIGTSKVEQDAIDDAPGGDVTGPDAPGDDVTGQDDAGAPEATSTARRSGSAAAVAASRARRIGGRPAVTRSVDTATTDGSTNTILSPKRGAATAPSEPVTMTKQTAATKQPAKADEDKPPKVDRARRRGRGTPGLALPDPTSTLAEQPRTAVPALLRWAPAAVLVVAAIVMAVIVAVSTHGTRWALPSTNSQRDEVLAAAKSCLVATNTYNYKDINAFQKKGSACASGTFAKEFTKTLNDVLRKSAPTTKQVQALQINDAGILNVSNSNQWDVLIYGQLSVTNTSSPTGRIDPFASVARMADVAGNWRITNLCTAQFNGPVNSCY